MLTTAARQNTSTFVALAHTASERIAPSVDSRDVLREFARLRVTYLEVQAQLVDQAVAADALRAFDTAMVRALECSRLFHAPNPRQIASEKRLDALTARQREVLAMVVSGYPSKRIAFTLGISQRTVEMHRASIMTKTGSASVPALTQLATLAGFDSTVDTPRP